MKKKYKCPCCGYKTLEVPNTNTFEICDVCFWENDGIQFNDINYTDGANCVSLKKARENYKKIGAFEKDYINEVRKPYDNEKN